MTYSGSWDAYIDPDEPPEITALWRATQQDFHAAMLAHDNGMHPTHCRKLQDKAYASLRALRAANVFPVKSNANPGKHTSQLCTVGEYALRRVYGKRDSPPKTGTEH